MIGLLRKKILNLNNMKRVIPKVKQIMNSSFDIAKEFNDVNVRPEHILL